MSTITVAETLEKSPKPILRPAARGYHRFVRYPLLGRGRD